MSQFSLFLSTMTANTLDWPSFSLGVAIAADTPADATDYPNRNVPSGTAMLQ